jgi:hypothetical protein
MDDDLVAMATFLGIYALLALGLNLVWGMPGMINLLHEERWYDDADVSIGLVFAALAVPAYLIAGSRAA